MITDLSIIIVNWNTCQLLAECLDSIVCNQSLASDHRLSVAGHQPFVMEVFVVDNASSDESVDMVRKDFPWVQVIQNDENVGFARANNQAITQATGRYVLLLNSDTRVLPGALGSLVAFGDAHPKAGVVGAQLINANGSFQAGPNDFPTLTSVVLESWVVIQRLTRNPYYPSYPPERSRVAQICEWVGGACLLARRTAIDQVGMLDEGYFMNSEDVDFCFRMREGGWQVWYTPEAAVIHLGGASANRSTAVQRFRVYQGKVTFLSRHQSLLAGRLAHAHFRVTSLVKAIGYGIRFVLNRDPQDRDFATSHWLVMQEASWSQGS